MALGGAIRPPTDPPTRAGLTGTPIPITAAIRMPGADSTRDSMAVIGVATATGRITIAAIVMDTADIRAATTATDIEAATVTTAMATVAAAMEMGIEAAIPPGDISAAMEDASADSPAVRVAALEVVIRADSAAATAVAAGIAETRSRGARANAIPYGVKSNQLLIQAQRLQALAQAGLAYGTNSYDLERYEEIRAISVRLLQELTEEPLEKIIRVFASEEGYQTPKVDIRAVLLHEGPEILLVREKIDSGKWTLPGGWADIGHTPFEVAAKEAQEESGLIVKPVRLLALFDKRKHSHPPQPWYVYKAFIQCEVRGGSLIQDTQETGGARWFREHELSSIELSTDRTTASQLEIIFKLACDPTSATLCD